MPILKIREVLKSDNKYLEDIINKVLIEFDAPRVGKEYDASIDRIFESFDKPRAKFFVLEEDGVLLGGAGIKALNKENNVICELQKMYFLPKGRGRGLGRKMIDICLSYAKEQGYEKCYLETLSNMKSAQELYLKNDFSFIDNPMVGSTCHVSCDMWMMKNIKK